MVAYSVKNAAPPLATFDNVPNSGADRILEKDSIMFDGINQDDYVLLEILDSTFDTVKNPLGRDISYDWKATSNGFDGYSREFDNASQDDFDGMQKIALKSSHLRIVDLFKAMKIMVLQMTIKVKIFLIN